MLAAERRQHILRAVRAGTAQVSELAERFAVSEMTVRRDLAELERRGKLERVHGGAVSVGSEPPFAQIAVERLDVKDRIGRVVAALAEDTLRQLRADIAFLGASAVAADLAVMDSTMVEVPIKRAMLAAADRTVLCVDGAKFAMGGVVRICAGAALDTIVTDTSAPADSRGALEEAGVEVLIA